MQNSHVLGAALAAGQVAYGLEAPRPPWMTRAIVALYLTTSTADAMEQRGARGAAVVAAAGAVGMGAEWLGVRTGKPFGPYDYSGQLGPKVADVPLLAGAAWAMMTRPSRVAAHWATQPPVRGGGADGLQPSGPPGSGSGRRRRAARVVVAAGALTAWDVFLDPRMVREGYWRWPSGGRYEGIPASNFVGWFATGLAIFAAAELIDPHDEPAAIGNRKGERGGASAGSTPGAAASRPAAALRSGDGALALYAWTWIGELIANVLLWRRPKVAVAGGLSMGAVLLPAMRSRLRSRRG